ncbi:MAG: alcohol dehydrogenase catalytic domain-containing protein [Planctomycetota bacterium]
MKGVCFEDIGKVSLRELPDPEISDSRDAIVRVTFSGLCGSDLHPFHGREQGLDPGTVMGHEFVGEIVAIGEGVNGFSIGDRVFAPFSTNCGDCYYCRTGLTSRCVSGQLFGWVQDGTGLNGCQSSLVRIPLADATLMKAPEGLSDEAALLLGDNFSTGFYCAQMAGIGGENWSDDSVAVVVGCGTVGQLGIVAARSLGAKQVVAVEPEPSRREAATALGAHGVTEQEARKLVNELTDGRGADVVMELVGIPAAQKTAYDLIRPGGVMSVIGCHCTPNFAFGPEDAYNKNLTYRTGRCPARHYMDKLTDRVASGEFNIDAFITHQFDSADCVEAYDVFANRKDGCVKAVFAW